MNSAEFVMVTWYKLSQLTLSLKFNLPLPLTSSETSAERQHLFYISPLSCISAQTYDQTQESLLQILGALLH